MTIVASVARSADASRTVEEGLRLAEAFDEELHVVHVLSEEAFYELERTTVEKKQTSVQHREIEETAAEIAGEAVEGNPPNTTTVGLVGKAADEVVRYSDDHDARFVVIGNRKRSPVGKAVFGSEAQSILLNADRTVVAVRND